MNTSKYLKELISPLIEDYSLFSVDMKKNENGVIVFIIKVSNNDIKRVIGNGGRCYRSIKTLLRSCFRNELVDLIIDIAGNK
jgi:predicted RNA-binding protein YlqC (UPF0109 family)